jgi:hypothetical protein
MPYIIQYILPIRYSRGFCYDSSAGVDYISNLLLQFIFKL